MRKKTITEAQLIKIVRNSLNMILNEKNQHRQTTPQGLKEGTINNFDYSHYAVNKTTKKIVNGWDYHDIDSDELRQFAKDYFIIDLMDNDLNPKDYVIWSKKTCLRNGVDPENDDNWANF